MAGLRQRKADARRLSGACSEEARGRGVDGVLLRRGTRQFCVSLLHKKFRNPALGQPLIQQAEFCAPRRTKRPDNTEWPHEVIGTRLLQ